jgi:hypothetical protein
VMLRIRATSTMTVHNSAAWTHTFGRHSRLVAVSTCTLHAYQRRADTVFPKTGPPVALWGVFQRT